MLSFTGDGKKNSLHTNLLWQQRHFTQLASKPCISTNTGYKCLPKKYTVTPTIFTKTGFIFRILYV